ncbi:MAG TPA: glycosyltransferase family 4 protein [Candidatus Paceibacterota bacterium]|nr:glycosyltransferase family 4 protein [Candidatus Paceibacterota bacterium]
MSTEVAGKHRILYAITLAWWGGAQRYVYDLAVAAHEAGHEVCVLTGHGELAERLTLRGITVRQSGHFKRDIGFVSEFRSFYELMKVIWDFKPNVVHANSSKTGAFAALAARVLGVKRIIFTAHGWAFNENRPQYQKDIFWLAHYATVLLSDRVICVSRAICSGASTMPFAASRLRTIYNGVEEGTLLTREDARGILAPHISFPFWIGTIAELHPNKQLHTLIVAFERIADKYPDVTLVIMGEGQERKVLEELIRSLSLESRVRLRGHVENAAAYLPALDIFVLPSRTEALGYVLLEAGLARLPVIASDVGGIPEVIQDNKTGLLFPSGDAATLAALLERSITDEELRAKMGQALYAHVRENFSKERMILETFKEYD